MLEEEHSNTNNGEQPFFLVIIIHAKFVVSAGANLTHITRRDIAAI